MICVTAVSLSGAVSSENLPPDAVNEPKINVGKLTTCIQQDVAIVLILDDKQIDASAYPARLKSDGAGGRHRAPSTPHRG